MIRIIHKSFQLPLMWPLIGVQGMPINTYYLFVFAIYTSAHRSGYKTVLRAFASGETGSHTAKDHCYVFKFVSFAYDKRIRNEVAPSGINEKSNGASEYCISLILVRCHNNRLKLAVMDKLSDYQVLVIKVQSLTI